MGLWLGIGLGLGLHSRVLALGGHLTSFSGADHQVIYVECVYSTIYVSGVDHIIKLRFRTYMSSILEGYGLGWKI